MKNNILTFVITCSLSTLFIAAAFSTQDENPLSSSSRHLTSLARNSTSRSVANVLNASRLAARPIRVTNLPNHRENASVDIADDSQSLEEDLTLSNRAVSIRRPLYSLKTDSSASSSSAESTNTSLISHSSPNASASIKIATSSFEEPNSLSDDSDSSSSDDDRSNPNSYSRSAMPATYYQSQISDRSLPYRPEITIKCKTFNFMKPEIILADSLGAAINKAFEIPVSDYEDSNRVGIFDVDGTLTTHPERMPNIHPWKLEQREGSVSRVRSIKARPGVEVFYSSAWISKLCTGKAALQSTLNRLKDIGFTNDDLGIKDGDTIMEIDVEIVSEVAGSLYIKAYKCGDVVSCGSPTNTEPLFRGKLFAAVIAQPQICNDVEVVSIIDDDMTNVVTAISDTQFNPYGRERITFVSILLATYKPLEAREE